MCIVSGVCGPVQIRRHSTTNQQRVDLVVDATRPVLVERQENEGPVVVEARVTEEGYKPELEP